MSTTRPHTIGTRYEETKDLDIKAIAKLIRRDIKTARANGDLPEGMRTSVRIERYSLGQSITVNATLPGPDRVPSSDPRSCFHGITDGYLATATSEQIVVNNKLHKIVNAYNWDDSDITTDYFANRFAGLIHVRGTDR